MVRSRMPRRFTRLLVFTALATVSAWPGIARSGTEAVAAGSAARQTVAQARAARVEKGLLPGILIAGRPRTPASLAERMAALGTPGVSVAVINDGVIEWARGYGVVEAGSTVKVTPTTRFQAASISKSVAALAALRLVEQGKLALDEDVNARLVSWKVPGNQFAESEKVTLRRLLSHTAGLTVHGFGGYAADAVAPHAHPGAQRREARQQRRDPRRCRPWESLAVLRRRLHRDAVPPHGGDGEALSRAHVRAGLEADRHERQHLRTAAADRSPRGGCERPPVRWPT